MGGTIPAMLANLSTLTYLYTPMPPSIPFLLSTFVPLSSTACSFLLPHRFSHPPPPPAYSLASVRSFQNNPRLTGSIPSEFTLLRNLVSLCAFFPSFLNAYYDYFRSNVANCGVNGTLPPGLSHLAALSNLCACHDIDLSRFPVLMYFLRDVANNNLVGSIPSEYGSLAFLKYLYPPPHFSLPLSNLRTLFIHLGIYQEILLSARSLNHSPTSLAWSTCAFIPQLSVTYFFVIDIFL